MNNENKKPQVGVGVMILNKEKVLLGKRNVDPKKADSELHGEGSWTMPGGKLDFKEKLKDAAVREVLEEIGIAIDKENLKIISVSDDIAPDAHFVTIGFLYKDFKGKPQVMEPEEIVEWKWFSLDKLPNPLYPPSRKIVDEFVHQSTSGKA